jgi:hypothetical protein
MLGCCAEVIESKEKNNVVKREVAPEIWTVG